MVSEYASRNESTSHPAVESTIWSMRGKGNGSLGQALLTSVKSIQSLHFPFALRTTTGLANHVGWSTPLTRPATSNFLISSAMNSWPSGRRVHSGCTPTGLVAIGSHLAGLPRLRCGRLPWSVAVGEADETLNGGPPVVDLVRRWREV